MINIEELKPISMSNRIEELERRVKITNGPISDFEGSVTANWVKLDQNAGGVVEYRGKEYVTKTIGWTSIDPGTPVKVTAAGGIYYSEW